VSVLLGLSREVVSFLVFLAGDLVATAEDGTQVVYNMGDIAWVLASTALVWIMVPGVGFFYSGLLR
jgi:Amt family ammonium transporter